MIAFVHECISLFFLPARDASVRFWPACRGVAMASMLTVPRSSTARPARASETDAAKRGASARACPTVVNRPMTQPRRACSFPKARQW